MLIQYPEQVERNWGTFLKFIENQTCTVKIIYIKKNRAIHLQYHKNRTEQWYLISGLVWVTNGEVSKKLHPGDITQIEKLAIHKMEGLEDSIVLEISKGIFDENDIVHLD